jgi:hypothetical protein
VKVIDKGSAKPGDPIYNGGLTVSAAKAAYQAHFGTHVPLEAMKILQGMDLVVFIQDAIANDTKIPESGFAFSPRGCIMDRATPTKGPNGELLH